METPSSISESPHTVKEGPFFAIDHEEFKLGVTRIKGDLH